MYGDDTDRGKEGRRKLHSTSTLTTWKVCILNGDLNQIRILCQSVLNLSLYKLAKAGRWQRASQPRPPLGGPESSLEGGI